METAIPRAKLYQSKDSINIPVGADLHAAAEWYMKCLGLQGSVPPPGEEFCSLSAPAGHIAARIILWRMEHSGKRILMERTLHDKKIPAITFNVRDIRALQDKLEETMRRPFDVSGTCQEQFQRMQFEDPYGNVFAALQEPEGWADKIGRNGDAPFLDWIRIPVPEPLDRLMETGRWYETYVTGKKASLDPTEEKCGIEGGAQLIITDDGSLLQFERNGTIIPFVFLRTNDLNAMYRQLNEGGVKVADYTANGEGTKGRLVFIDLNGNHIGVAQA